jgi:hypothetical protein
MAKEIRCNNSECPMSIGRCGNYSDNAEQYDLVQKQFDISTEEDEQPFYCETYEPLELYR